jgi:hypothetical protein
VANEIGNILPERHLPSEAIAVHLRRWRPTRSVVS